VALAEPPLEVRAAADLSAVPQGARAARPLQAREQQLAVALQRVAVGRAALQEVRAPLQEEVAAASVAVALERSHASQPGLAVAVGRAGGQEPEEEAVAVAAQPPGAGPACWAAVPY